MSRKHAHPAPAVHAASAADPTAFRYRGMEMARIDAFSDVVFGFALTLLVVSLEVPKTFAELTQAMRGFFGFAPCFLMLILVWYEHYKFFKRYAMHDIWTIVLNTGLLFVVLFYVYPMKFLTTVLVRLFTGEPLSAGEHASEVIIQFGDMPMLMIIYGCGFTAVYGLLSLMYWHAWRRRDALELNDLERFDTRQSIVEHVAMVVIGVLSIAIAVLTRNAGLSGFVYWLIALVQTVLGLAGGKRRRKLEQRAHSATAP